MPINVKSFERAMKAAAEEKKNKAALSTPPVAAPVAKPAEQPTKPKLSISDAEIQGHIDRLIEAAAGYDPTLSSTDRAIYAKLEARGIKPNIH